MSAEAAATAMLREAPRKLRRGLRALRLWVRLLVWVRVAVGSVAIVSAGAAAGVLLFRLHDLWYPFWGPEAALGVVVLAAAVVALVWPLSDTVVAASADRRMGLRDRVGSAVEFVREKSPSGMEQAAILDALHHLGLLRPREAFPVRAPRGGKTAGFCLAALLLVQMAPIPALLLSPEQREERAELRQQAAKIEPLTRELEEAAIDSDDEEAEAIVRELRKFAQQLRRGQLDKKQALLSLSELEKQLEKLDERLAQPRSKTAAEAAEKLARAARESVAAKAMELARQAAQQGDEKAARELERMAEQARTSQDAGALGELAKKLDQQASKLGASLGLPSEVMAALAESLGGGDLGLSEVALNALGASSQEWASSLSREELEALAEELKELSKLLEGTDLSELSKLLAEASECLKVGNCDQAGKLLAKAGGLCKSGLAKAKLAAACRACALGLGRCRGGGVRYGRGGPARQEHIPPNAPASQLFAPRVSDNPGDLERVRAQITPQGEMMTTTERGAPVRVTESRVPYYEVIADYSKTAEEALNREEVPAAYRGTVRAYFDALQSGARPAGE
ncbi:MAG TPA: hypothetical protein VMY87_01395 [Armatimonadota bacterium]|nr:hypothetical protein [Armatimonadota bacterium]